ncbi:Hypothetical protein R9X50_00493300 [Acrodontium crateriforme]|uniref:CRIB domain-containing protein n=1 Tax=Acrodontium crateriforme TaxID=150365 RepID=A0AAQ3M8G7_9PEZI|nr:Hypothetical protein R9X50_00493300 [Acrodontium crateriforme]
MRHSLLGKSVSGFVTATEMTPGELPRASCDYGQPDSDSSRPRSSMSESGWRRATEPFGNFRTSLFAGRKLSNSSLSRQARPPSRSSTRNDADHAPRASCDTYRSEIGLAQEDRRCGISPPFNFKHVSHTSRDHLAALEKVDETHLRAEFWSVSGNQRPRRYLSSGSEDAPEKRYATYASRKLSLSRSQCPTLPHQLSPSWTATPIGVPYSIDEAIFDDIKDTSFTPDEVLLPQVLNGTQFPPRRDSFHPRLPERPWLVPTTPVSFESSSSVDSEGGDVFRSSPETPGRGTPLDTVHEDYEPVVSAPIGPPPSLPLPPLPVQQATNESADTAAEPTKPLPHLPASGSSRSSTGSSSKRSKDAEAADDVQIEATKDAKLSSIKLSTKPVSRTLDGSLPVLSRLIIPSADVSNGQALVYGSTSGLSEKDSPAKDTPANISPATISPSKSAQYELTPETPRIHSNQPLGSANTAVVANKASDSDFQSAIQPGSLVVSTETATPFTEQRKSTNILRRSVQMVNAPNSSVSSLTSIFESSSVTKTPSSETQPINHVSKNVSQMATPPDELKPASEAALSGQTNAPAEKADHENESSTREEPMAMISVSATPMIQVPSMPDKAAAIYQNPVTKTHGSVRPDRPVTPSNEKASKTLSIATSSSLTPPSAVIASTRSSPRSAMSNFSNSISDDTWEDDVDFLYQQEAESRSDFDWRSLSPNRESIDFENRAKPPIGLHSLQPPFSPTMNSTQLRRRLVSTKKARRTSGERTTKYKRGSSVGHQELHEARSHANDGTCSNTEVAVESATTVEKPQASKDPYNEYVKDNSGEPLSSEPVSSFDHDSVNEMSCADPQKKPNRLSVQFSTATSAATGNRDSKRYSTSSQGKQGSTSSSDHFSLRSLFSRNKSQRLSTASNGSVGIPDLFPAGRKSKTYAPNRPVSPAISSPIQCAPPTSFPHGARPHHQDDGMPALPSVSKPWMGSVSMSTNRPQTPGDRAATPIGGQRAPRRPSQRPSFEGGWI